MIARYSQDAIVADLKRKMVFVAGPRQVGKTTLAKAMLPDAAGYMNWDVPDHREKILRREYPAVPMLALDEIHKYRQWRNYLKGLYDGLGDRYRILVTGSARLDFYRFGGDSLQGRYHFHRLFPLSVAELQITTPDDFTSLLTLGGFPEPFFSGSETQARRWTRDYRHLLVNEEIVSLENVSDLGSMQLLAIRLPDLVGSPLSINALREDLNVSHKTVSRWVEIFARTYMLFRLSPFGAPAIRAVKKEQKHYFHDWNAIQDDGSRFENLIASHLLKWTCYIQDTEGRDVELMYFRDTDGREVDFIVTENGEPVLAVEARRSDRDVSKSLRYFKAKFPAVDAFQVSARGGKDHVTKEGIHVLPAVKFLSRFV